MASIGFTFAFAYTCLTAYLFSRWSSQTEIVPGAASTKQKLLAGLGVVVSLAFMLVLLVPGSPGQLSTPSFIAMGAWALVGLIFYFTSAKRSASLSDDALDVAVLGSVRPVWARTSLEPASRS